MVTLGITLLRDVLLTLDFPNDHLSISEGVLPPPNGRDVIAYTTNPESAVKKALRDAESNPRILFRYGDAGQLIERAKSSPATHTG